MFSIIEMKQIMQIEEHGNIIIKINFFTLWPNANLSVWHRRNSRGASIAELTTMKIQLIA